MTAALHRLAVRFWRTTVGNPVLVSVMSRAAHRPTQMWVCTGYLVALLWIATVMLSDARNAAGFSLSQLGQVSQAMFTRVAILQMVAICLISPLLVAGAVLQQRDPKSLLVLLATPLSNTEIVLGNLFSRVLLIWTLLLAGLPILAMAQLLGRVDQGQIFTVTLMAAATALLTGSVAVAWSGLSAGRGRSPLIFYAGVFGYLFLIPILGALPAFALPSDIYKGSVNWLTPLHPTSVLTVLRGLPESFGEPGDWQPPEAADVRRMGYGWPWDWYLSHPTQAFMSFSVLASLAMVIPAIVRLRSEALIEPQTPQGSTGWGARLAAALQWPWVWLASALVAPFSSIMAARLAQQAAELANEYRTGQAAHKHRQVWTNPIAWREAVTRAGGGGLGAAKWMVVAAGVIVAGFVTVRRLNTPDTLGGPDDIRRLVTVVLFVEAIAIVGVVLNTAAAAIARERESKTLDLLLTTVMTPRYYIWGKLRGVVSFAVPMLLVPPVTVLMVAAADALRATRTGTYVPTVLPDSALHLLVLLTAFSAAVAVLALRISLASQKTAGALIKSFLFVIGGLIVASFVGGVLGAIFQQTPLASLSGFSPLHALMNLTDPWRQFPEFFSKPELAAQPVAPGVVGQVGALATGSAAFRVGLIITTVMITAGYIVAVYVLYNNLVTNWQATIRRMQS